MVVWLAERGPPATHSACRTATHSILEIRGGFSLPSSAVSSGVDGMSTVVVTAARPLSGRCLAGVRPEMFGAALT